MTIFGVRWEDLRLAELERFLADAGPEPLLWEAKGVEASAGQVRRQVCAFANSHDGGYLIIGASQGDDGTWTLDGVEFPDEPPTWVANVVGNGGVNPYPDGLDTKSLATADGRYVAVVRVPSTPTPPCNAHGTVYERVSGRTIPVREPLRLSDLFARGDEARREAQSTADNAARGMLYAGRDLERYGPKHTQFGLGVAAVGYLPDLASRIFSRAFEGRVLACIGALDHGPSIAGRPRVLATVAQDLRQFVSEGTEPLLGRSWIVRATWHGDIGIFWTMAIESQEIDTIHSTIDGPIRQAWTAADELLGALGAQGARYLQLDVAGGGNFPPNEFDPLFAMDPLRTVVGRGPLTAGVHETVLTSIERELRRAAGQMAYEEVRDGDDDTT